MRNDDSLGGYLIPETFDMDVPRRGRIYAFVRWLGERTLRFGAALRDVGYEKKTIYPLRELHKAIREMALIREAK